MFKTVFFDSSFVFCLNMLVGEEIRIDEFFDLMIVS